MRRLPLLLATILAAALIGAIRPPVPVSAMASGGPASAQPVPFAPSMKGNVVGYRLAGIEPDGDPLDQVVLSTHLSPSRGVPGIRLIVDSYLENFKPDTTPILPDLLHPNRTAQNLAGFLQGKALLTDDAGNVLYIGSFLAEAFLGNSNHAVMRLDGTNAGYGGKATLKGNFFIHKDTSMNGSFSGRIVLPPAARHQIAMQRGTHMKDIKKIIDVVTVRPAPMVGRATSGSNSAPLKTNFGSGGKAAPTTSPPSSTPSHSGRSLSAVTIIAGVGAIVSLVIGLYLFWTDRQSGKRSGQSGDAPA